MSQYKAWVFDTDYVNDWAYAECVFSAEECKKIIGESTNLETAILSSSGVKPEVRNSSVEFIYATDNNRWIFERMANVVTVLNEQFFKFDVFGMLEGLQFTKYTAPNGFYDKHIDQSYGRMVRKLSVTVQLSDPSEYEGGNLLLHTSNKPLIMDKELGKLIAFPSYTLHEVSPVTKGTRYSLVCWVSGKPFK
jgi:PKHD-type hydroxylase